MTGPFRFLASEAGTMQLYGQTWLLRSKKYLNVQILHSVSVHPVEKKYIYIYDGYRSISVKGLREVTEDRSSREHPKGHIWWYFHCCIRLSRKRILRHLKEKYVSNASENSQIYCRLAYFRHHIEDPGDEDLFEDSFQLLRAELRRRILT